MIHLCLYIKRGELQFRFFLIFFWVIINWEWDSDCASIVFDEYTNFKLKKIKLDVESKGAEYCL